MIVIEIAGGLGNQMFQYAFYLKMKGLGYDCRLYYDEAHRTHNGLELEKAFGLEMPMATQDDIDSLLQRKRDSFSRVKKKVLRLRPSFYWEHDKGYKFKSEVFQQARPVYLQGCWLSEKYFYDIKETVRQSFRYVSPNDDLLTLEKIKTDNHSVSIHIRRGDYLTSGIHRNIEYKTYIENAIRIILARVYRKDLTVRPNFYVFSDDINYAFEVMQDVKGSYHVYFPDNKVSYLDMQMMSACRHNIIANSTFSWWAAWLNANPDKVVLCPDKWFTTDLLNDNDIVPERWVKIAID